VSGTFSGVHGGRCLATDPLGNRCHKDATHVDDGDSSGRRHDASRGDLQRVWV
jgi:hypothetical protein